MKSMKGPMILGNEGMPQYEMVNKQRYKMLQNYYALKYARPSCNEYVQP